MGSLRKIPNVGKTTEQDLIAMGYTTVESLKGKTAYDLYDEECALRGALVDRCQLYLYRAVEYFVNNPDPDPENSNGGIGKTNLCSHPPAAPYASNANCILTNARDVQKSKAECIG